MTREAYALLVLTGFVAALVALLVFAVLRFAAAARDTRRRGRDGGSEPALLAGAFQEAVTKLKAQERAMAARAEASERLSTQIVASLTAGLLVVATDGTVRIVNRSARRLLGIDEPASGQTYLDVLGPGSQLAAVIGECLVTAQPIVRRVLQVEGPDGTETHLGVTVSPLVEGGAGDVQGGAICLFTDISAVVDLEEQLRLKDTLARLGELTAGLAHEFRNGLATIHGYARLLDPACVPERERPCVEGIRNETDALGRLVTNFLTFARPEQLTVTPADLRGLATQVADDLKADAAAGGGRVEVGGELPTVEGDEVLLRQALSNLVRNALEACRGAGVMPVVTIHGVLDGDRGTVRIRVTDNGPGIPEALRERIFRPFFTTRRDGTGLGLALVQKIVVTHNGRVTAHAAPGGGACLEIALPLSLASAVPVT